jgi:hypothetical protein
MNASSAASRALATKGDEHDQIPEIGVPTRLIARFLNLPGVIASQER